MGVLLIVLEKLSGWDMQVSNCSTEGSISFSLVLFQLYQFYLFSYPFSCHLCFVAGFNNIISFSLKLNIENITGFYQNDTLVVDDDIIQDSFVSYNVKLYCCFTNTKCGTILANGSRSDSSEWRLVIDTNGDVDFSTYQVRMFMMWLTACMTVSKLFSSVLFYFLMICTSYRA